MDPWNWPLIKGNPMATAAETASERHSVTKEIGVAARHSVVYGIGGILTKAVSFLLLPFYTHYLTPRDYGVLEILDLSMSLLAMFLNMGVTAALLKYYGSAETDEEKRNVIGSTFLFALSTGALVFLAGMPFIPKLTVLLLGPQVPSSYLFVSFGGFVLNYISNVPYTHLRAKEASGRIVVFDIVVAISILALNIYFIVSWHMALFGVLLSPVIVGVVKMMVLIHWMAKDIALRMDWRLLRRILEFGAPLILFNLTMFTLNFSDRYFLQRIVSLDAVGLYAVGYKFGFMLNFLLIQPFNMMWQARMYLVYRRPDHCRIFGQVFVLYSAALLLGALGLALFGSEIVRIMADRRYADAGNVVAPVALAYVFLGIGYYLQLGMFVSARTGMIGLISAAAAIVNLACNEILITRFGMMGAAWATVIGFFAIAAGSYYFSQRVCPLDLPVGRVVRGLAVALAVYLAGRQLHLTPALMVVAKSTLLLAFPFMLRAAGVLSHDELETFGSLWRNVTAMTRRLLGVADQDEIVMVEK
jgi:O-antigen/teichoic acid export membrane protein